MSKKKRTIMLGFHSPVDGRLMREWLTGLGYEFVESLDDTDDIDLVLMDSASAHRLMDKALGLKRAAECFLPVLVCINAGEDVGRWLMAGFDDALHLPAIKREWRTRIEIMLRLRRQSEALGKRNDMIYRMLVDSSSDQIFILDANGTYVTSNGRVEHFGLERGDELVGKTIDQVYPKEVAPFYREQLQRVLTEREPVVFEHDLPTEDDAYYHVDTLYPINLPDGTVMVGGICRDITVRKKAEEALRENRERLNHLFTVNPTIVYELDPENFSSTWVSPNIAEIAGYTPEEALQPGFWAEHVHPEDREEAIKAQERLRRKGRLAHEYRFEKKDGTCIWVRDEVRVLRDEQGTPREIVGSWMNITDRKDAELKLAESEQRYRSVVENTGTAMVIVNEDGAITFANNQCTATTGYSPEELQGTSWRGYVFADDLPMMENYFQLRFSDPDNASNHYEARLVHADGSIRNTMLTVGAISAARLVVFSLLDITDRIRAEEARRVLETAINSAQECVMVSDRENRLTYVNRAFERLSGYSTAEALGNTPRMLKSGVHDRAFYRNLETTIYSGHPWEGSMTLRKKNSDHYDVHATITPVLDESGTPAHFVSVHRDMTRERELERRFQQNQRLEAIGTLAGGIAHDFNNLLVPILGYTELSVQALSPGSKTTENLEQVLLAANRAKGLVRQILSFSRRSNRARAPLCIAPIVKEALTLLRASIPSTINIKQEIHATTEMAVSDPTEIHQVVMNLCTNAYQAMPDGGDLTVTLKTVDLNSDTVDMIPNCRPGRHLQLSVEDTGQGIPPEIRDRIFEPYFTTKEEGRGTGLGLAVIHSIMTASGGGITMRSELGNGTRFNVYLPVAEDSPTDAVDKRADTPSGHERILLVDDEPAVAELGQKMLEVYGYSVTIRMDPAQAVALFKTDPGAFDMVITDMTMPGMTGDQLVAALLDIRPDLPIIAWTGFSERINEKEAQEAGIRGWLEKPFSPDALLSTMREIFDREE